MKKKKKNSHGGMKLKLFSSPENGCWRATSDSGEMGQISVIRTRNARRKRILQIRRLNYTCIDREKRELDDKESSNDGPPKEADNESVTEMSLSLSSSLSSASDNSSSENYDVLSGFEEKTCGDKEGSRRELTCASHGLASLIGRRKEMEDAVRVEVGFMVKGGGDQDHDQKYDFFAVYDGHGGSRVAEACKERLHRVLVEVIAEEFRSEPGNDEGNRNNGIVHWERVMDGCFEKMDQEVNRGRLMEEMVGSTAVVTVVGRRELVVANCGDSRAVLSRGGVVVPLSIDHKPDRPDELRRVEAAGGRVINWNGNRILGVLATSRSIGDQYLKPFVICKPEVMVIDRTNRDEFLILASDGLWDVVSNEVACQVVRRCFSGHIKWATSVDAAGNQNRATRAAAVLAELAMARGSNDNISVIVVELNKPS